MKAEISAVVFFPISGENKLVENLLSYDWNTQYSPKKYSREKKG
ncbi:hypothetical protein [Leptotrichia trevisanii]|jgi:hypothetical protein|nr:hypothetical protein [Leptotrichia trevisanii]